MILLVLRSFVTAWRQAEAWNMPLFAALRAWDRKTLQAFLRVT